MDLMEAQECKPRTVVGFCPPTKRQRLLGFAGLLIVLLGAFALPLYSLANSGMSTDLHSHVFLIPLITVYLVRTSRVQLPQFYSSSWHGALLLSIAGAAVWFSSFAPSLIAGTALTLQIVGLVCFVNAGGFAFLGGEWMRAAAFPMAFLVFMAPLPDPAVHWLEHHLKVASAEAAAAMFDFTGMAYLREGMIFQIPGITIEVADECSGIRSSYVLFITSTLASYLFLRSNWRRSVLALAVIPLGILRNGFRILVICWLCVEVGPEMIHSVIHHKGGPLFFVLSLFPFAALLWWLRRGERKSANSSVISRTSDRPPNPETV